MARAKVSGLWCMGTSRAQHWSDFNIHLGLNAASIIKQAALSPLKYKGAVPLFQLPI